MPFSLNTAPLLFTKVMLFSILCLTKADIWALPYLDDILIIARTRLECLQKVQKAVEIVEGLGWIINTEKSRMIPQQVFNWLGVHYNLLNHTVQNTVETQSIPNTTEGTFDTEQPPNAISCGYRDLRIG